MIGQRVGRWTDFTAYFAAYGKPVQLPESWVQEQETTEL